MPNPNPRYPNPRWVPAEEQLADISARYRSGETCGSIAADYPVGRQTITRVVRELGVHEQRRWGRVSRFTAAQRAVMADRYRAGASTVRLAREFGTSNAHISQLLAADGVERRPRGRPKGS